ncbi:MAG: transketolase [Candidatus Anammoximicrobium sp.]|nr:transketolase [Candidatus Anammoximicrobium sp.]
MRSLFNKVLVDIAKADERIWMILADIGYGEIEPFRDTFPDRWYNCGVAEQNMTGVACGVALEGNIAITYSIANFPTLRCLEQIRNDVCYHHANVKIVIIGGGLAYGALGVSHQATEDIAIMRALPNMVVFCPCDFAEAEAGVHAMIAHDGPFYYRCGYKKEPPVHAGPIEFQLGRAIRVRDGRDLTFLFTGTIGSQVVKAAETLNREGLACRVLSMHTVKPLDREAILAAAEETGGLVVVEEHQISGGLGGAVAEVLADACVAPRRFLRIGLPDVYVSQVGSHEWLLDQYGLSAEKIAGTVRTMFGS